MQGYRTLKGPCEFELDKLKGSRFLARAAPVADERAALEVVREQSELHQGARHHCFAYRLGINPQEVRSSDAREPKGSAGLPILRQIEAHAMLSVIVVVTRYFGGIKLGVGGLIRAYGEAARRVLDQADWLELELCKRLCLRFPYACSGVVESTLQAHAVRTIAARYSEWVEMDVDVPLKRAEAFRLELCERCAGKVNWL